MIEVREGRLDDLDIIVDFQIKMAQETEDFNLDRETVSKGVKAVLEDHNKGKYYIAGDNEQILGTALTMNEWSEWRNGNVLWIHSVYIKPLARRTGIFKQIYKFLKDKISVSSDYKGMRLYVDKSNLNAQKTYEALGMNKDHYLLYEWIQ